MAIGIIEEKILWDRFIDTSPYGLLFHKWDFLKIIEKHTGFHLFSYGIYKGQELIAVFPLFYKNNKVIKAIFSPPPRTAVPYMGFVMTKEYDDLKQNKKETYISTVVDDINTEIKKISPSYVSISIVPNFFDMRPFQWHEYEANPCYTYILDLNKNLDEIWYSIEKNYRRNIRKTEHLKLSVCNDISNLYMALKKRYSEQGFNLPIISSKYLEDLLHAYPAELVCYCVYDNNQTDLPLTSILIHKYKRIILWIGGIKTQRHLNQYLFWELIKKAKEEGYTSFEDQGGNTKNLCKYKNKINPDLGVYFRIDKKNVMGKLGEFIYKVLLK